ncbi:glycine cleavage system protein GcvH [Tautonia plasticadhaerens]|uniref:Glycine cleavage system H protein n=1 Tax=Tautonia plasticadhaerens TaxID=2527974 RepID=A0A518H2X1_9BACT|nr:glycine cleavage system protein GcvH [Tautonia plasticadhaerens]QDV35184.1 Glycine cleavage system H protein [Tautonia plasticadhaerens]
MDPKDLKYAASHEWVKVDGDVATVGISAFAVEQLTDLIMIDLGKAKPGASVSAGDSFGEVESVKSVNDLYAPISGEVIEVNPAVAADVGAIAADPFGSGWIVKLRPSDAEADLAKLMDHAAYQEKIAEDAH